MTENMEILLRTEDKPELDKITTFIKSMDEEKQDKIKFFIEGANFVANLYAGSKSCG